MSLLVAEIFADLLRSLDPGVVECIESALKQQSNSIKLSILMELKQTTRQFAVNLDGSIAQQQNSSQVVTGEKCLGLAQAIYEPYVPYVAKYGIYEGSQLGQQLNGLELAHDDLSDTISALSLSLSKIMDYANEANKRCKLFTEGCAYPALVKTYNVNFLKILIFFF